jgi:putative intracellular protease/amidase
MDPDFVDPVQKYKVNTPEACRRMRELIVGDEWAHPLKISEAKMADYDAIVLVGGLGADLDLINNPALHKLLLEGYYTNKLLCAICFAVGALLFTRDPKNDYKSIVYGKRITAHPRAWDFTDSVSYDLYQATPENAGTNAVTPGFLIPLQDVAMDAIGPKGACFSDPATNRENPSVVYDYPFVTGCSVESSIAYGRKIRQVLAAL